MNKKEARKEKSAEQDKKIRDLVEEAGVVTLSLKTGMFDNLSKVDGKSMEEFFSKGFWNNPDGQWLKIEFVYRED